MVFPVFQGSTLHMLRTALCNYFSAYLSGTLTFKTDHGDRLDAKLTQHQNNKEREVFISKICWLGVPLENSQTSAE